MTASENSCICDIDQDGKLAPPIDQTCPIHDVTREHLFTEENAAEKGRKGGQETQRRNRLRRENPSEYLRETLNAAQADLVDQLLSAAKGTGRFQDLSSEKRLTAIIKALEYSAGKPTTARDVTAQHVAEATGLSIS